MLPLLLCLTLLPASQLRGQGESAEALVRNFLRHPFPAADFTLVDQHGLPFHMAETRGKVVVMSFIYTHCTDFCPFIALKVKEAYRLLGREAEKVVFVAVTTDPKRDITPVTAAYSRALGMYDAWHFVSGAPEAVQAVWASYGIGVTVDPGTAAAAPSRQDSDTGSAGTGNEPTQGLTTADLTTAGEIIQGFGGGYDVGHSAPFWIVDAKGEIRAGMDAQATPEDIVRNVRVLMKLGRP
jgi:cytochrome oxidase Cu insertion factor (SCO1/SenC/PrrC family)